MLRQENESANPFNLDRSRFERRTALRRDLCFLFLVLLDQARAVAGSSTPVSNQVTISKRPSACSASAEQLSTQSPQFM